MSNVSVGEPKKKESGSLLLAITIVAAVIILVCLLAITALGTRASGTFQGVANTIGAIPMAGAPQQKEVAPPPGQAVKGEVPAATTLPRKIIRTANIEVVVDDFDAAEQSLMQLLAAHKDAYVAQAEVTGSSGSPRHGLWRIRVPVAEFEDFVAALGRLGVPRRNSIDSKDVTEEFYDLDARIKNQKIEEARLLKHLENSTGKLEEILAVEKEISRVRGEIERQEGRLRLLSNLIALTTVTVSMQEIKNYVPPAAPTFGKTITTTFFNSIELLVNAGRAVALAAVAITPWLPVIALVALPTVWYYRRRPARVSQPAEG